MHSRKSSADSSDICFQTGLKIGNELSFKPHQVFGKKPSQQLESTPFDLRKKYECLKESHPYHKELHLVKQAIIKPTYIDHEAN